MAPGGRQRRGKAEAQGPRTLEPGTLSKEICWEGQEDLDSETQHAAPAGRRAVEGCALVSPRQFIRTSGGPRIDSKVKPTWGGLLGEAPLEAFRNFGEVLVTSWGRRRPLEDFGLLESALVHLGRLLGDS